MTKQIQKKKEENNGSDVYNAQLEPAFMRQRM